MAKNEVVKQAPGGVPAHLAQYAKARIGNIDASDQIVPRIKLLQAISPELQDFETAKAGNFWHTVSSELLGNQILGVPIIVQKSYVLWSPRNDDRGILARARDGVHWDVPNTEFTVKPKGSPSSVVYNTKNTVAESGLDQFGSSIPGDPQSVPAASLTYNMLWYFPELEGVSPIAVIINTRSSIRPMQHLLSRLDNSPYAHYLSKVTIGIKQEKGAEGPFYNYVYTAAGFVDEDMAAKTKTLYDKYSKLSWAASDESSDVEESGGGGGSKSGPSQATVNEAVAGNGKF